MAADQEQLFGVGELAHRMDTTVRTLQYYDREGLLQPSVRSAGGRRLYTNKDMVKLHQIMSMKYLGFSLDEIKNKLIALDTPEQVIEVLSKQREVVIKQRDSLTAALQAIEALEEEVSHMQEVDFEKYANIISLLRLQVEDYWFVKFFDNRLITHLQERFTDNEALGLVLYNQWKQLCEESARLKEEDEAPEGLKGQDLAKRWWELVMDFTGGDMSMLPELMKFNESKQQWDPKLRDMQARADEFINKALAVYLIDENLVLSELFGEEEVR